MQTLALAAVVVGLGACGGGGTDAAREGVASLGGSTTTRGPAGGAASNTGGNGDDPLYELTKCMRDRGVDVPDPAADGSLVLGPATGAGDPGSGTDARLRDALKACDDQLGPGSGPGSPGPAESKELEDEALAFARCMRQNGVDLPDPAFGPQGITSVPMEGVVPPEDPKFAEAAATCARGRR